ncbi:hypothetical protein EJB05_00906, partial [Eragrostis curvula]
MGTKIPPIRILNWPSHASHKLEPSTSIWTEPTSARTGMSPPAKRQTDAEKLGFIEEITSNVEAVQERVLADILSRNAESEYLRKCGATDRATFRAKVPMVTYEDLKPYIRRIAVDGDGSPAVLTGPGNPVTELLVSSGTSGGEPKLLPYVQDDGDRRLLLHRLIMAVMKQYVPEHKTGRVLRFLFVNPETMTPGGLPARTATTSSCKSQRFKKNSRGRTSPVAAILCEDAFQSMHAQVLCGLCQRHDVVCVGAVFATGLLRSIQFLQENWEQLAGDIEAGELISPRVTDESVREAVGGILRRRWSSSDRGDLAEFIRTECSGGDWAGIIRRIWPNTKYINTIVTGSMAQYIPALNYYSGGLPVASTRYSSTECPYGLNLRPFCDPTEVSYTIIPTMGYFEFLPIDAPQDKETTNPVATQQQLVDLASVEVGREYELLVTTYSGLNRYGVGDILRVTGFHNSAPQFRFVCRKNVVLSVDTDKTDEADLQHAVERAAKFLRQHGGGADVLEYTSRVCTESIPGHYIIYWELVLNKQQAGGVNGHVLDGCCLEMEEALSSEYRLLRAVDKTIAPLEIQVVRSGTFQELMDHVVSCGTSMSQYKVPRCVTEKPQIVELLKSRVVSSNFSSKVPHWAQESIVP